MQPEIQVIVLTYNHAKYIRDCLEGILRQKTHFAFKVLVFEDCSTDGTQEILKEYAGKHPEIFELHLSARNRGDYLNLRDRLPLTKSPFIAFIDGDDYWMDELKLQKSVEFLKAHPDYVAYAQNVQLQTTKDGGEIEYGLLHAQPPEKKRHTLHDLIASSVYHHTSALVFRNVFKGTYPPSYNHPLAGDWFFSMLFAEHGDIYYDHTLGSVYRIHGGGMWSKLTALQKRMRNLDAAHTYNLLLNRRYESSFAQLFFTCFRLLPRLILSGQPPMVILKYLVLLGTYPIGPLRYLPFRSWNEKIFNQLSARFSEKPR